jgi:hypothetical protein
MKSSVLPTDCTRVFSVVLTKTAFCFLKHYYYYYYYYYYNIGTRPSPLGTAATVGLLYQPQMTDDGDCEATGGMKTGRENRSTRTKPAPVPLCSPQIPHDLTPGSNPVHHDGKPATNRLNYSTAMKTGRCL